LARKPDLQAQAGQFAKQLTDVLNRTITDGVRIKSVLERSRQEVWVGYEITQATLGPAERSRSTSLA
jgi:hypothetical protein